MEADFEERLNHLRQNYLDFFTPENKVTLKRLLTQVKDSAKIAKESPSKEQSYYQSLVEQVGSLQRKVKGHCKSQVSDYQAFRWQLKKQGQHHKLPELFALMKIPDQLRRLSTDRPQVHFFNAKPLTYSTQQLCQLTTSVLEQTEYNRQILKPKNALKLIRLISQQYNINSYHNFSHSVSVFLLLRQVETTAKLSKSFSDHELFLAEMASLAHDIGHKGLNSLWEVKKKTPLAVLYDNQSVLEKMHVARFFKLLREHPDLDFFHSIKDISLREKSKKLVTNLILATDMSKHFTSIEIINEQLKDSPEKLLSQKKELVLQMIFHACDIGNPCMEFEEYINWSVLLSYQFNNQALKEQKEELPITQGFKYTSLEQFYKGQLNFISTFCVPVWKNINQLFPEASTFLDRIEDNSEKIIKKLKLMSKK